MRAPAAPARRPYRNKHWAFLRDVWRWNRARLAEAIMRAAAAHHFIEYTRRDAIARPREPLPGEVSAAKSAA